MEKQRQAMRGTIVVGLIAGIVGLHVAASGSDQTAAPERPGRLPRYPRRKPAERRTRLPVSSRDRQVPDHRDFTLGFRVVLSSAQSAGKSSARSSDNAPEPN